MALFRVGQACLSGMLGIKTDLLILFGIKFQRDRINAVSEMRGGRSIVEHMPQVGFTTAAYHFRSPAKKPQVRTRGYALLIQRLPETRPASAGIIFGLRIE